MSADELREKHVRDLDDSGLSREQQIAVAEAHNLVMQSIIAAFMTVGMLVEASARESAKTLLARMVVESATCVAETGQAEQRARAVRA